MIPETATFTDEIGARRYLAGLRWPQGVVCPHCQAVKRSRSLSPRLYQCAACRKQFSVRVGTIFQDSNAPLHKWLGAIFLMCSREAGTTAAELHRELGFGSYRTAWSMCRRMRWALGQPPMTALLRRAGVEPPAPARRPLRIRLPWDQTIRGLLAVTLETRDRITADRKSGAKLKRRANQRKRPLKTPVR